MEDIVIYGRENCREHLNRLIWQCRKCTAPLAVEGLLLFQRQGSFKVSRSSNNNNKSNNCNSSKTLTSKLQVHWSPRNCNIYPQVLWHWKCSHFPAFFHAGLLFTGFILGRLSLASPQILLLSAWPCLLCISGGTVAVPHTGTPWLSPPGSVCWPCRSSSLPGHGRLGVPALLSTVTKPQWQNHSPRHSWFCHPRPRAAASPPFCARFGSCWPLLHQRD